ncbi:LuxR family transcriptional regulator [Actinoplanes sp. Pm04-4]|uniref:LuxR family transcriptional regulator n=1 Tax=Paractinoplanes pyxinae TaxID=2997416 RepID=A0ABT4AY24_9ACTN|nr:LuxR family transcriptional regulator [Actinoplanes pyxinae]MCY1139126.1 LuxR family transcriptional regulator [Actinoplanes pyxinae]
MSEAFVDDLGALLVTGEPGVGKTTLLDAAAARARQRGRLVLRATGVELEADLPFSALHQLLLPLRAGWDDVLEVALGGAEGDMPERAVVAEAVLALLRRAERPVLLVVDDLSWIDRASAAVLEVVAREVAFLGAARLGLGSFFRYGDMPVREIRPLTGEAADRLLRQRFPALPAAERERVLAEAQGNPLALLELPTGPSRRLRELFAPHVRALTEPARWLLLLAALDTTGDRRLVTDAGALGDLERARLLHLDDATGRLVFRHPLIRSTAIDLSTGAERRRAHQRLAELFADQPDRSARHLGEATVWPDESVAARLERSARSVLDRGDTVGAVAALTRAAELTPGPADRSRRRAAAAYVGAHSIGRLPPARQALPVPRGSLQIAVTAAHVLLNGEGDIDTAHRLLAGALADDRTMKDAGRAAVEEALYTLVSVCFFGGRPALWQPLRAALDDDSSEIVRLSHDVLADPARLTPGVLDRLDAALAGLPRETDPAWIIRLGLVAQVTDRQDACHDALERVAQGDGLAVGLNAQMLLARHAYARGRWDEAQRLADDAAARCREHGYVLLALPGRHVQAQVAAARGDDRTALAIAAELLHWATPRGVGLVRTYAWQVRTVVALGRGDFEQAYLHASRISPAGTLASHVPWAVQTQLDLVEAAARAGRTEEAAAHVAAVGTAGTRHVSPRLALLADAAAAVTAPDDRATVLFERALAAPGADRWPFDLARVRLLHGERLRRMRAVTAARAELLQAAETFERLGAEPWSQRAAAELRATAPERPGGSALTPQEGEIARLAAAGLSNKQIGARLFLSPRTVQFHLHHVFAKLGIRSRAALRDALDRP